MKNTKSGNQSGPVIEKKGATFKPPPPPPKKKG
jgi:hypothetical protein